MNGGSPYLVLIIGIFLMILLICSYKLGQRFDNCILHWHDIPPTEKPVFNKGTGLQTTDTTTVTVAEQQHPQKRLRDVFAKQRYRQEQQFSSDNLNNLNQYKTVPQPGFECVNTQFCHGFPEVLQEPNSCAGDIQTTVIILIESQFGQGMLRDSIRSTWASVTKQRADRVKHVFLLAATSGAFSKMSSIRAEISTNNDMLIFGFHDSPSTQTIKILAGMDWLLSTCHHLNVVLRVSSNMYVNVAKWMELLERPDLLHALRRSWFGNCPVGARPVVRDPSHAWYIPESLYSSNSFPRYCDNSYGYGIGKDLMAEIVRASKDVPYIPFDDSFLGLVANRIHLGEEYFVDIPNLAERFDDPAPRGELHTNTCDYVQSRFMWRFVPWDKMDFMWNACSTH